MALLENNFIKCQSLLNTREALASSEDDDAFTSMFLEELHLELQS